MSELLPGTDCIIRTLNYYRPLGLVKPIAVGRGSLVMQLEGKIPLELKDLDVLAAYTSIRSLASSVKRIESITVEEERFSPEAENGIRDRAALRLSPDDALRASGIADLQAFTGVETDRTTLLYTAVLAAGGTRVVQGVDCMSIADVLAWKIRADRPKDREHVPTILRAIEDNRAVSYAEWDEIRRKVGEARRQKYRDAEQIWWSAT